MPATRAERLTTSDAESPGNDDGLCSRSGTVCDDAARRIDPDLSRYVGRHARGHRRERRALVDCPSGARVGFTDFLDHLYVRGEIDFASADVARHAEMEHSG